MMLPQCGRVMLIGISARRAKVTQEIPGTAVLGFHFPHCHTFPHEPWEDAGHRRHTDSKNPVTDCKKKNKTLTFSPKKSCFAYKL